MQGEVTGPGQCSNQIDTFGKECLKESKLLYPYKNDLGVPPLGMVDDVLAVSRCGVETVEMNAFLNQKTNMKKLQFGPDKCHQLHIGKKQVTCPDLFIDEWKLQKKDELKTGLENLEDVLSELYKIEVATEDKYLGDIISVDGKNTKNIQARAAKAQGILKQLKTILEEMAFGRYLFEVAVILRDSLFVNGILTNLEASYGLTDSEMEELEKCDEQLLRIILECPCTTPKEMLYLELGVIPIRYIVMSRRLMFYHYILNEDSKSLIHKFYKLQSEQPVKGDWCLTVKDNLKTLEITMSESQIKNLSIYAFKKIVSTAIRKEALNYLVKLKNSHSKVLHIQYRTLKMQDYLVPSNIPTEVAKFTFLCRSRMLQVGANFKMGGKKKPTCPVCKIGTEYDSQPHLMLCPKLIVNTQYDELFGNNLDQKLAVVHLLTRNLEERNKILKEQE